MKFGAKEHYQIPGLPGAYVQNDGTSISIWSNGCKIGDCPGGEIGHAREFLRKRSVGELRHKIADTARSLETMRRSLQLLEDANPLAMFEVTP
jgi:hypothetical protein